MSGDGAERAHPTEGTPSPDEANFTPRGAMFFAVIFLVLMIAIWGTMYFTLLDR